MEKQIEEMVALVVPDVKMNETSRIINGSVLFIRDWLYNGSIIHTTTYRWDDLDGAAEAPPYHLIMEAKDAKLHI